MTQLLIQIITGANAIISAVILIVILANWGQPHMKYLAFLAIIFTVNAVGYYLEVTSTTLEGALVAYKIQYCAGNYIGPCASLFAFEYAGRPIRKWPVNFALFIIPVFINLLVFIDPALYISDITFVPLESSFPVEMLRMSFKPGGFYFVNFIYGIISTTFSSGFIIVWFIRTNRRGMIHSVIFFGIVILPIICKIFWWMGFFPEIDFFYIASTFVILVMYWYIMRYRQIEWFSLGREAVMERLADAVMIVNAERMIINVNSIFFHFFPGFSYIEGRTTLTDFLDYLKDRTITPLPQSLFDDLDPALQDFYEFTMIPGPETADERRTYTLTWQTIRVKKRFLGQAIILSDVSAYRTMIEEIIKLKQRAEEASRSKSEFLATVSHEIRTPLNAIIGLSEIQLQNNLPQEARANMEKIYTSGSGLLSIINDILDISKIETGNLALVPVLYSVPSLVNDTVQLNIIRIGSKPIDFKLDIDESIPLNLWGDEKRVRQILNNLLSNAFKYTQEGTVSLQIKWTPGGDREGKVTFTVTDTGQGIKREDMGKLFSQYGQLNARANRNIEGTGLGLSITKNLVEIMNGTIEADSEFGKGSTFTVTIRQELNDPAPIGRQIAESLENFRFTEHRVDQEKNRLKRQYPGSRVLVVDDVETNLYVARGLLQPYGLTVDCVTNGQEAIANIFSDTRYNIVFMDHMMPGMDGIETTRIIREYRSEYTESLPIIALTANAIVGMKEMFLENGFNDYLSKPIDRSRLDEILVRWMPDPDVFKAAEGLPPGSMETPPSAGSGIPPITGVDMAQGIALTGNSPELYRDILVLYCRDVANRLAILSEIPQPEKLPEFAIHVHAIKSASANIGAGEICGRAAGLEAAAKNGDILFIERRLGDFTTDLCALTGRIQTALYPFGLPANKSPASLTASEWEALGRLREALETEEIRLIEAILEEIKVNDPSPALQQILDDIAGSILVSEFAEAAAVIDGLTGEGNTEG